MIACDIYPLAGTLQAYLPDPHIYDTVGDPLMQNAVADRCIETCQQAGIVEENARIIGEALAGYLYGWCSRDGRLDEQIRSAQTALNRGSGGSDDYVMPQRPIGSVLPVGAIALMVAGVVGLEIAAH
jgi:hypothetical protein